MYRQLGIKKASCEAYSHKKFIWLQIVTIWMVSTKWCMAFMVKFMHVIRRTSEFGLFLLQSLAFYISPILMKFSSNGVLYHPCQVCPDISTMIDKGVCFIDYFPLYRLFWGLFSTIKHLPVDVFYCPLLVVRLYRTGVVTIHHGLTISLSCVSMSVCVCPQNILQVPSALIGGVTKQDWPYSSAGAVNLQHFSLWGQSVPRHLHISAIFVFFFIV